MRRFLRWLVGVMEQGALYDELRDLRQRTEELEDDSAHWERRFKKLQGQVTRAWRDEVPVEEEEEDEFERLLEEKRRARA